MGRAMSETYGFPLAKWNGCPIPEIGVACQALGEWDTHFGMCGDMQIGRIDSDSIKKRLGLEGVDLDTQPWEWGPRVLDLSRRGGTVAEVLWNKFQDEQTGNELAGFLSFFGDFNNTPVGPYNASFPPGARSKNSATVNDLAGELKYRSPWGKKRDFKNYANGYQFGTRWSKTAIEYTIKNGGNVHFHLDGMEDISQVIDKNCETSHNITSRELRYIYRNWTADRKDLRRGVRFYNGFTPDLKAVEVVCPWDQNYKRKPAN